MNLRGAFTRLDARLFSGVAAFVQNLDDASVVADTVDLQIAVIVAGEFHLAPERQFLKTRFPVIIGVTFIALVQSAFPDACIRVVPQERFQAFPVRLGNVSDNHRMNPVAAGGTFEKGFVHLLKDFPFPRFAGDSIEVETSLQESPCECFRCRNSGQMKVKVVHTLNIYWKKALLYK